MTDPEIEQKCLELIGAASKLRDEASRTPGKTTKKKLEKQAAALEKEAEELLNRKEGDGQT